MNLCRLAAACALTLGALLPTAHAAPLPTDGSWVNFAVDGNLPPYALGWVDDSGEPLQLEFTIAAGFTGKLTVVDTGFSGDRFTVSDGPQLLGDTSVALAGDTSGAITFDADAALANPAFSRGVFTLTAGSHRITGLLSSSLTDANGPLNATIGAVRLEVSPVPEPASLGMLMAGLGALAFMLRRRSASN